MATARMEKIFLLEVEQPEDSFFSPAGVVVVGERQKITLFCQNSAHNLYRAAIIRHEWTELERGLVYRNVGFRIRDITNEMEERGWFDMNALPQVLAHMQQLYPRHLYFLTGLLTPVPPQGIE